MIAASQPNRGNGKLLILNRTGAVGHLTRGDLGCLFEKGDLVVANDAATLPASLTGIHEPSGRPIEIRLAGWVAMHDPRRFVAIVFGEGDYHTVTEERPLPPWMAKGDRLLLGPLHAEVGGLLDHPRLITLKFLADPKIIFAGLATHGRPIQYAHVPQPLALWDVWTRLAAVPVAFEPPSAGFALDWRTVERWRSRGIALATLTHAAGISSTGDTELDQRLPLDEPYFIPERTAALIRQTRQAGGRIIAMGTTVVRALESAADPWGLVHPGSGIASGRIGPQNLLKIVDAVLPGMHQPGESHFELLRAFAKGTFLEHVSHVAEESGYRSHEFGDSMLIERQTVAAQLAS